MPNFTAHRHPVLAVRCPDCGTAPGMWCRQPSGQLAGDFHLARMALADQVFIEQHGPDACIERESEGWILNPHGRINSRPQPEPIQHF